MAVVLFFVRVARFTLLSYRIYLARIRVTESECLLFEEHTFYRSKLSDVFSDMYCLKIRITFHFHTATIIQAREMIAENNIEFSVDICN